MEFVIILSAVLIIVAIFGIMYFKYSVSNINVIKTTNVNFIQSFEYDSANSIFLSLTGNLSVKNFNLTVDTSNGIESYSYVITSYGKSNFNTYGIIANSTLDYPSYSLTNICAITYTNNNKVESIAKNCSS